MNDHPSPYETNAPVSTSALINLLISMFVAAGLLGAIAFGVSKLIYLIILFPILMGLGLGIAGRWMIRLYNIRNTTICVPVGLIGGILTALAMHFTGFQEFRWVLGQQDWTEPVRELAKLSPEERQTVTGGELIETEFQELLRVVTAGDSFLAYLTFNAREGVEISNAGSGSGGINLGYVGTWIYWGVEILIIGFTCVGMLKEQARAPFCESSLLWMKPLRVDSFESTQLERLSRCVLTGDPQPLLPLPNPKGPALAQILWFQSPVREESDADIAVIQTLTPSGKKEAKAKWISSTRIPKSSADAFLDVLKTRAGS